MIIHKPVREPINIASLTLEMLQQSVKYDTCPCRDDFVPGSGHRDAHFGICFFQGFFKPM